MDNFIFYLGIFGLVILVSALLSRAVERTPLSQAMVFVALGLLLGPSVLGWVHFDLESPVIEGVLLLTLVLVLFIDGTKISPGELRTDWVLPARALGPGILLTVLLIAGSAIVLLEMEPLQALLLAFILAPTDPVLISAILEDERIPRKVRQALSVESGLNDGVAISAVLLFIGLMSIRGGADLSGQVTTFAAQLGLGPLVGIAVGFAGVRGLVWVRDRVGLRREYEAIYPLGLAFVAYAAATAVGGSGFLAAFVAGVTASSLDAELCDCFHEYGEATGHMLMMLAFVLFGSSLVGMNLSALNWRSAAFIVLLFFVARPVAIFLAMVRAPASRAAKGFIAWFGPRGMASIVLSILPVAAGLPGGEEIFALTSLMVLASIILHGISAAPLAGWYARRSEARTLPEQLVARLQPGIEGGAARSFLYASIFWLTIPVLRGLMAVLHMACPREVVPWWGSHNPAFDRI